MVAATKEDAAGDQLGPAWLQPLLETNFFSACTVHTGEANKAECNLFCLDCAGDPLCSMCTSDHRAHRIVQIRRSSYHDVIRVSEIQKCLDLSGVQSYVINSARVVFLNQRPQPRHAKGVTNTCEICARSLLDTFKFCSLGCKLEWIRKHRLQMKLAAAKSSDSPQPAAHPTNTAMPPAPAPSPSGPLVQASELNGNSSGSSKMTNNKKSRSSKRSVVRMPSLEGEEDDSENGTTDMSPHTPPRNSNSRGGKRRKGVPHRAPL